MTGNTHNAQAEAPLVNNGSGGKGILLFPHPRNRSSHPQRAQPAPTASGKRPDGEFRNAPANSCFVLVLNNQCMEGKYQGSIGGVNWFEGTVTAVHADGRCDILYDDGDDEESKAASEEAAAKLTASEAAATRAADEAAAKLAATEAAATRAADEAAAKLAASQAALTDMRLESMRLICAHAQAALQRVGVGPGSGHQELPMHLLTSSERVSVQQMLQMPLHLL